jgi:hypothetical protein
MNRQFTPGKKEFAAGVEECRRLSRKIGGQVKYFHVYRDDNIEADVLSKIALKLEFTGTLE